MNRSHFMHIGLAAVGMAWCGLQVIAAEGAREETFDSNGVKIRYSVLGEGEG